MTDKTPAQISDTAAEAIRALNHATLGSPREDWEYPGDAYSVIGNLSFMAGMLGQAVEQATALVGRAHLTGHLTHDKGLDPDTAMQAVTEAEQNTQAVLTALNAALGELHSALSPLGYRVD